MSAAPGTEALDVEEHQAAPQPDVLVVRHARPARPVAPPRPAPAPPSGAAAWVTALRLRSLPTTLTGALVALLLAAAEPTVRVAPAAVAVGGLVVLHLLSALLRALGDPTRHRAGPLRRIEAGRGLLALAATGMLLAGALTALAGWPAPLLAAAGLGVAVLAARRSRADAVAPLAAPVALSGVWWATTGALPWRVLLAAAVVAVVVAALRAEGPSRALLAAPCAAVGLAVGLHALPWPALLVAAALPAARRAAANGQPAAAPARLALVLLLAGLGIALVTGADLPLTAAR